MAAPPPAKSPPPGGPDVPEGAGSDERPTLIPDFDPEAFARDSETRQRLVSIVEGEATIDQARRLHASGDHEHALFLLTRLLELTPLHPEATHLAVACRIGLEDQCLSAIGSEGAILVPAVTQEELTGFTLDNVSAFLFSRLDGATSVEEILDVAGLPRLPALRHLRSLLERGIIAVRSVGRGSPPIEPAGLHDTEPVADDESVIESSVLSGRMGLPTLDAVPVLLIASGDLDALTLDSLHPFDEPRSSAAHETGWIREV